MSAQAGLLLKCWYALGFGFWKFIFEVLNRAEVIGRENRPGPLEDSVLILSNHISAIDPFLIATQAYTLFSPVRWHAPAKAELFDYPVVRNILTSWGAFPVRRGERDFEAMSRMAGLLKDGVMIIFPEGRRSRDGKLLPGRPGVGKIIWDGRPAKIIPVVVEGTQNVLRIGRILPSFGKKTRVYFGKAIDLSPFYLKEPTIEVTRQMVDQVMERLASMQDEIKFRY